MIRIKYNGKDVELAGDATINDFLMKMSMHGRTLIIEHNGEIITGGFERHLLKNGDIVNIFSVVAGG